MAGKSELGGQTMKLTIGRKGEFVQLRITAHDTYQVFVPPSMLEAVD